MLTQPYGVETVTSPILQLKTQKLREAELLAQDHTIGKAGISIPSPDCGEVSSALGPDCRDVGFYSCIWAHRWASLTAWNIFPQTPTQLTSSRTSDLCPEVVTFSGKISLSKWQTLL